jgi:NAD(P)-dependent dehydrogenase (short-subunit alcohol dehydrogenase family)
MFTPPPSSPIFRTLPLGYRALVIGASGAIGSAFVRALRADSRCATVTELSRSTHPGFALEDGASIATAVASLSSQGPFHLVIDATGALVIDGVGPEKQLGAVRADSLARQFAVNATGPVLLLQALVPHLATGRAIYAKLSARVGSVADNRKGGWYAYRAAKAALNMLLQTAALELAMRRPELVVAALQPGTVASKLSAPFVSAEHAITADEAAQALLQVLDGLPAQRGAYFRDSRGENIPW